MGDTELIGFDKILHGGGGLLVFPILNVDVVIGVEIRYIQNCNVGVVDGQYMATGLERDPKASADGIDKG